MDKHERRYEISSVGLLYWKSLELFATRLESPEGQTVAQESLQIDDPFFVIFPSGTGFTRTSGVRVR